MYLCKICNKEFKKIYSLAYHINKYHKNIILRDYYDKYLLINDNDKFCKICNKLAEFQSLTKGYKQTCNNIKCIKENRLNNMKKTCMERFGVENSYQSKEIKDKIKKTKLELHDDENYNNREKSRQTCFENHGVDHNFKLNIEERIKNRDITVKKLYNKDNVFQLEWIKKLSIEGSNNRKRFKSKEEEKIRYDLDILTDKKCPFCDNEKKFRSYNHGYWKTCGNKKCINRSRNTTSKETNLNSYDVEYFFQSNKFNEKIKRNNNILFEQLNKIDKKFVNSSKKELQLFNDLKLYFSDIIIHYKSDVYPFMCDFYIPSKDLYIELNLHWTHGGCPFNKNNKEHLEIIEQWRKKSEELNFKGQKRTYYNVAINVWTKSDVKKRNVAKKNNLNYIEIFSNINIVDTIKDYKEGYLCLN